MIMLINGSAKKIALPDKSVNCVVTSPPYFGLRDYGTAEWVGGDAECEHTVSDWNDNLKPHVNRPERDGYKRQFCIKCGAIRVDKQIGLEQTPDDYVAAMVQVFREVWRVLHPLGTVFLNLGDSYNGSGGAGGDYNDGGLKEGQPRYPGRNVDNLKPKDLIGIPWRVAFALQTMGSPDIQAMQTIERVRYELLDEYDGQPIPDKVINVLERLDREYADAKGDSFWLRSEIIWHKPNPMPESVKDRPTKAHEQIFLLTKSARYWYDNEAIKEDSVDPEGTENRYKSNFNSFGGGLETGMVSRNNPTASLEYNGKRNKRSVWTVTTKPYPGSHYAVFPPDLIEPCVLAGCPETACAECGAPYERVVEKDGETHHGGERAIANVNNVSPTSVFRTGIIEQTKTIGFEPTCDCNAGTKPGVVLDPFVGSGTTCMVARKHNRDAIGIDLSYEYLTKNARERLQYGSYVPVADGIKQFTIGF